MSSNKNWERVAYQLWEILEGIESDISRTKKSQKQIIESVKILNDERWDILTLKEVDELYKRNSGVSEYSEDYYSSTSCADFKETRKFDEEDHS